MSTLNVGTIKSIASNVPPVFQDSGGTGVGQLCQASIRFNQTGTQAINQSFNVSSITDEGTGDTSVNFTNVIRNSLGTATASYSVTLGSNGSAVSTSHLGFFIHDTPTSSAVKVVFYNIDNSNLRADSNICCVSIHA